MNRGQLKLWIWLGSFPLLIGAYITYYVSMTYFALRYSAVVVMEKKLGIHNFDVREVHVERYFNDERGRVFIYLDQPFDFDDLEKRKIDYKRHNPETDSGGISPEEASKLLADEFGFHGFGFESLAFSSETLGEWTLCPNEPPLGDGDIAPGCGIFVLAKDGSKEVFIWIHTI
jgi:hypothetical protein